MKDYFGPLDEDCDVVEISPVVGRKYGKWTVVERVGKIMCLIKCDCGKIRKKPISILHRLVLGQCSSCYKKSRKNAWRIW